jgi:hypothetical protein
MKKLLFSLFALGLIISAQAQNSISSNKKTFLSARYTGLDYNTPSLVNSTSIGQVLSDKKWAQLPNTKKTLGLGLISNYSDQVDIYGNLDLSISTMPGIVKTAFTGSSEYFYASMESGVNVKMFKGTYFVNPYLTAGLGIRSFDMSKFGAYAPVGFGLQLNVCKASSLNLTAVYATKMSKSFVPSYNYGISYNFPLN